MKSPRIGIGVLIFKDDNILLGERILSHGSSTWAPPGGHLEFGETFATCGIREVEEETGLILDTPTFFGITNDIFLKDDKHYVSIFLSARFSTEQVIINREPEKIATWKWFNIHTLPDNLFLSLRNLLAEKPTCLADYVAA